MRIGLKRLFRRLVLPAAGVWLCFALAPVSAAVVLQMGVAELSEKAESVLHGRVVASRSEWTADGKSIVTHVTVEVLDNMKGSAPQQVTLTFTGGTVDGVSLTLSGLRMPSLGDEGIYFIEGMNRGLDCPILGWNQGHFRIRNEGGERRVFTADGRAVTGLDPSVPQTTRQFSEEIARGVRTAEDAPRALGVGDFKNQMRGMMGGVR